MSKACLKREPSVFYNFVTKQMYYPSAKPNAIHKKIAAASHVYHVKVITQNVDGLHLSAGTDDVLEFHGNLYHVYCQKCAKRVSYRSYLDNMIHQKCGGILRPDIVLYGESISSKLLQRAIDILEKADLIVICGTSLRVYPFAGLIQYRSSKAKIVAINRERIVLPNNGEMILEDAEQVFVNLKFSE